MMICLKGNVTQRQKVTSGTKLGLEGINFIIRVNVLVDGSVSYIRKPVIINNYFCRIGMLYLKGKSERRTGTLIGDICGQPCYGQFYLFCKKVGLAILTFLS